MEENSYAWDIWRGKIFFLIPFDFKNNKKKQYTQKPKEKNCNLSLIFGVFSCHMDLGNLLLALESSPNQSFKNLWLPEILAVKSDILWSTQKGQ